MSTFTSFQKFWLSVSTFGGATFYYIYSIHKDKVSNSWTTHFKPSTKWDDNWDFRAPKSLIHPKELENERNKNFNENSDLGKPTATRHIILIRHGQYNMDGTKDEERILTQLGRRQAHFTGKRLKELDFPYTDIVKSTMTRAQETGSIISEALPHIPVLDCHLLREGAPIPPEPPVGSWKPGVHQFYQDGARIEAAFRKYFHRAEVAQLKDSYTVLVCHANVIRYFVCRALQFPPEAWLRLSLNHASITWISITPSGRVILRTLGDSGHLPANLITSH